MTEPHERALAECVTVEDFEAIARGRMEPMFFDYYAGAAGDEWTLAENRRAFERWVLRPRVLVGVEEVDLTTTVLGREVAFPILVPPMGFQRLAHPDGELGVARAVKSLGGLMVLSTVSTIPMEDVVGTGVSRWFQLYVMRDRSITEDLVGRAHKAGFEALVLTVDTAVLGARLRDVRNRLRFPPDIEMASLPQQPMSGHSGAPRPEGESGSELQDYFAAEHDPSLRWGDLPWLRSIAPMPLVLKGILTADDARRAADAGVDAIIVSNHGGRQLDGVPASLDALPEVADAVGDRIEVYVDGGIRRGTDVLKALALGARAVLVGRPVLWGLAAGGEDGVRAVIEMLRDELLRAMRLAGRRSISEIDRSLVAPAPGQPTRGDG